MTSDPANTTKVLFVREITDNTNFQFLPRSARLGNAVTGAIFASSELERR